MTIGRALRLKVSWVRLVLAAVTFVLLVACGGLDAPGGSHRVESERNSLARAYASQVRGVIPDSTSLEEFVARMPADIQPEIELTPTHRRMFTWRFADGSRIIAYFNTRDPQGSGQGLVLYAVDLQD
jgi:hypothetical protein